MHSDCMLLLCAALFSPQFFFLSFYLCLFLIFAFFFFTYAMSDVNDIDICHLILCTYKNKIQNTLMFIVISGHSWKFFWNGLRAGEIEKQKKRVYPGNDFVILCPIHTFKRVFLFSLFLLHFHIQKPLSLMARWTAKCKRLYSQLKNITIQFYFFKQ